MTENRAAAVGVGTRKRKRKRKRKDCARRDAHFTIASHTLT